MDTFLAVRILHRVFFPSKLSKQKKKTKKKHVTHSTLKFAPAVNFEIIFFNDKNSVSMISLTETSNEHEYMYEEINYGSNH